MRQGGAQVVLVAIATLVGACRLQVAGLATDGTLDVDASSPDTRVDAPLDAAPADAFDGGPTDATVDAVADAPDTDDAAPSDAGPCPTSGGDLCAKIPQLVGTATVDGFDHDLCSAAPSYLDAKSGAFMTPTPPPPWVTAKVWARVAWSSAALHLHFRVSDATPAPPSPAEEHWRGDGIELYVAGHDALTGKFDGTKDAGAMQIIITRPTPTTAARASIFYEGVARKTLEDDLWRAIVTLEGYAIELRLPWTMLAGTGIAKGKRIGIDFAVNDRNLASAEQFYSAYHFPKSVPADSCGYVYCDDRLWCTPALD